MDTILRQRGRALEELFFRKRDAELMEEHRRTERMKETRAALEAVSGIRNAHILDALITLEVSPSVLASLAVLPLVEVAWASGSVHARERCAIFDAVERVGIGKDSIDYHLLQSWLKHRPSARLFEAWKHYIAGLCEVLSPVDRQALKKNLIDRARSVAKATGGFLGLTSKISSEEKAVLHEMEAAFSVTR